MPSDPTASYESVSSDTISPAQVAAIFDASATTGKRKRAIEFTEHQSNEDANQSAHKGPNRPRIVLGSHNASSHFVPHLLTSAAPQPPALKPPEASPKRQRQLGSPAKNPFEPSPSTQAPTVVNAPPGNAPGSTFQPRSTPSIPEASSHTRLPNDLVMAFLPQSNVPKFIDDVVSHCHHDCLRDMKETCRKILADRLGKDFDRFYEGYLEATIKGYDRP